MASSTRSSADPRIDSLLPLHPRDFHVLLGLVDRPRHGYGLVKEIERRTEGAMSLDPANLYRAIQKLDSMGLVTESPPPEDDPDDDRRRRYYTITPRGSRALVAEAGRMRDLADAVDAKDPLPSSENP